MTIYIPTNLYIDWIEYIILIERVLRFILLEFHLLKYSNILKISIWFYKIAYTLKFVNLTHNAQINLENKRLIQFSFISYKK